jgi:hypothetical protein
MVRGIFATILCAFACLALPVSGLAQGQRLTASIPFDFGFGERQMAKGNYTIQIVSNGVVQIRSEHSGAYAMVHYGEPTNGPAAKALLFRRYGDSYFLAQIDWLGRAVELPKSKVEREIAKNYPGTPSLETAAAK